MAQIDVVGFQGEPGAFSEQAAVALLGDVATRGYPTFESLVAGVDAGAIRYALLPCENTIYGQIAESYDLLGRFPRVQIVDETTLAIEQCLIGLPGSSTDALQRVLSHPVAIEQCRRFFRLHPSLEIDASNDTAGSVRRIIDEGNPATGAIGPAFAAERYGAIVLERGIQDDPDNTTRFFLIARESAPRRRLGRAALALTLPNTPGSLQRALGPLAQANLNLRALLARPSRVKPFEYIFYVEMDAPLDYDVLGLLEPVCTHVAILGRY